MLFAEVALHFLSGAADVGLLVSAEAAFDAIVAQTEIWNWWRGRGNLLVLG
jgi:hypothetical protein